MGATGRRILIEQHAPEVYASALIKLAATANNFAPVAAYFRLSDRVGDELGHFLRPDTKKASAGAQSALTGLIESCIVKAASAAVAHDG
jgi:hypothetical protein